MIFHIKDNGNATMSLILQATFLSYSTPFHSAVLWQLTEVPWYTKIWCISKKFARWLSRFASSTKDNVMNIL